MDDDVKIVCPWCQEHDPNMSHKGIIREICDDCSDEYMTEYVKRMGSRPELTNPWTVFFSDRVGWEIWDHSEATSPIAVVYEKSFVSLISSAYTLLRACQAAISDDKRNGCLTDNTRSMLTDVIFEATQTDPIALDPDDVDSRCHIDNNECD